MRRTSRILLRLLIAALIAAALSLAMLTAMQRQMIYPGAGSDASPWQQPPARFDVVELATRDGLVLKALFRPPEVGQPTLLFFHGNGDSAFSSAHWLAPLMQDGRGALLVNYRGYLGNPGSPDEAGLYADAEAGAGYLSERGIDRSAIVVGGFSLGTGVASHVASSGGYKGLFLVAPFTSMQDAARHHFPWAPVSWLMRDRYPTVERIAAIDAPLLIVHGKEDRMIPAEHSLRLAQLRPDTRLRLVERAGHNDIARPATPLIAEWLDTL